MAQLPIDISYLASDYPKNRRCPAMASVQFSHHNILLEAYRQRARRYPHVIATKLFLNSYVCIPVVCIPVDCIPCRLTEIASKRYQTGLQSSMDNVAAWNSSTVDWTIAAKVS